jgi:Ca-activated chloride channel family protein
MMDITFAHPKFLFLLLLIPVFIYWIIQQRHKAFASIHIPTLEGIKTQNSFRVKLLPLLNIFRIIGFIALVLALARPQKSLSEREITTEGIDIVLALDVSGSMLALDFKPDRLGAAKLVAQEFIDSRPNDRIGLVVFAGESFTQCPITTDHKVLTDLFKNVKSGLIEDGTAIGMGLATAVSRLQESDAVSKVVIIMTDGVNNAGYIDPLTSVELAKSEGIRVYTIGVGNNGMAPYPAKDMFGRIVYQNVEVNIDEDLLKTIASETGGKYFRATNNATLKSIYNEIDQLEKSKINVSAFERKSEHFFWFAFIAFAALFLEILLSNTYLRKLI